jgi:hypothetical protein
MRQLGAGMKKQQTGRLKQTINWECLIWATSTSNGKDRRRENTDVSSAALAVASGLGAATSAQKAADTYEIEAASKSARLW